MLQRDQVGLELQSANIGPIGCAASATHLVHVSEIGNQRNGFKHNGYSQRDPSQVPGIYATPFIGLSRDLSKNNAVGQPQIISLILSSSPSPRYDFSCACI